VLLNLSSGLTLLRILWHTSLTFPSVYYCSKSPCTSTPGARRRPHFLRPPLRVTKGRNRHGGSRHRTPLVALKPVHPSVMTGDRRNVAGVRSLGRTSPEKSRRNPSCHIPEFSKFWNLKVNNNWMLFVCLRLKNHKEIKLLSFF
jgi:hypothetical protein